jgi:MoaA/NifB/PqqE/SkfB family radical SAM enzyme
MFGHHIDKAVNNTNKDGSYDEMKLVYWDFRFSNLCNMKCRMCGGHLSSMWVADEDKIYHRVSKANPVVNVADNSIDNIYKILNENMEYVEEIYFAGGEPLIMDEHYYILEKLNLKATVLNLYSKWDPTFWGHVGYIPKKVKWNFCDW